MLHIKFSALKHIQINDTVEIETLLCKMVLSGLIKSINNAIANVDFDKVENNERRELLKSVNNLRNICDTFGYYHSFVLFNEL